MTKEIQENLPDELLPFVDLPSGIIYTMGERYVIQQGLFDLAKKHIVALGWDYEEEKVVFEIKQGGGTVYTAIFPPVLDSVFHHCNCLTHSRDSACSHVFTALGALFRMTQGRDLSMLPVDPQYVQVMLESFRESLETNGSDTVETAEADADIADDADEPPEEAPAPIGPREIELKHERGRGWILEASGSVHPPILLKLGFPYMYHDLQRRTRAQVLNYRQPGMDLVRFVQAAAPYDLPVVFYTQEKQRVQISGDYRESEARVILRVDPETGKIDSRLEPASSKSAHAAGVVWLSKHAVLDDKGDLLFLKKSAAEYFLDLADPKLSYWSNSQFAGVHFRVSSGPFTAAKYNHRALAYPPPDYRAGTRRLDLRRGEETASPPKPKDPRECALTLSIRQGDSDDVLECEVQVDVDGEPVQSGLVAERLTHELVAWDISEKLFAAKTRAKILLETALQLPLVKSKKERNALINAAVEQPVFKRLRLQGKARKWLSRFERNWLEEKSASRRPLSLLAFPQTTEPWRVVAFPGPRLARLWLGLIQPRDREEFHMIDEQFKIYGQSPAEFLKLAGLVCTSVNCRLRFHGKPVEREKVDVIIHAGESEKIDWFELSPEIVCGKLSIPQEEWEALMKGDLILQEEGKYVLPELTQQEAVERLQQLFGKPKPKKGGKSAVDRVMQEVPRLQMLDWMLLSGTGVRVHLPEEARRIFENLLTLERIEEKPMPDMLQADMRDYQKRGFDWLAFLYEHQFGACLADDMGLGKTLQAIALLAWHRERNSSRKKRAPHLAVVPPSLVFNWQSEIERFSPNLTTAEYTGNDRNLTSACKADVIITTYDIVRRDLKQLQRRVFDIVIFDETQTLKNLTAARTKAALTLRRKFTLCLTGTPMENHAGEYYSIMNLALPGIFGDYRDFRQSLRDEDDGERILRRARPFVLRRTKEHILKELPPKVENDLHLDMTEEQKEIYTRTVGEVRDEVMEAYRDKTHAQAGIVALSALTRLRQVCISPELLGKPIDGLAPKVEYLLDQLEELHDEGHAVLVFSQFTRALDLLQDHIKNRELPHLRLDGKTPQKKRKNLVRKFQEDPEPHIFLVSLKAGGVGLNLTRANYVYHADPWWNPAVENQASDRAHRIGQTQTVFIQRLLMRHTIEEKMMALKKRKQQLFDAIINTPQAGGRSALNISRDDFEFLLGS